MKQDQIERALDLRFEDLDLEAFAAALTVSISACLSPTEEAGAHRGECERRTHVEALKEQGVSSLRAPPVQLNTHRKDAYFNA
jgi:hypothetical protein